MQSALVVNSTRNLKSKRRGRFKMCTYRDLKAQYGAGVAKQLRDNKKEQELTKEATDGITYWCEHPDFKGMGKEDWGKDIGKHLHKMSCLTSIGM